MSPTLHARLAFPADPRWSWQVLPARGLGPIQAVGLAVDEDGTLRQVRLNPAGRKAGDHGPGPRNPRQWAVHELGEYLAGRRRAFTLRWALPDTLSPFRRAVLQVAAEIPFGATWTYGEVAARAGSPGGARAVGGAMGANPLPVVIPCHRVVAAGGRIGGFTGGVSLKRALLRHEGVVRNPDDR